MNKNRKIRGSKQADINAFGLAISAAAIVFSGILIAYEYGYKRSNTDIANLVEKHGGVLMDFHSTKKGGKDISIGMALMDNVSDQP